MKFSLTQLEYFYYISLYGSFAKAANSLQISKAQISQSLANLERTLGHKLFHRTTRSVTLTTEGENLLPLVASIIKTRKLIEQEANVMHNIPAGLIRITCPHAFAECYLSPSLPLFLKKYPQIQLDLRLSSALLNLENEKIDLAIRLTNEPPLDKVAKQLGVYQLGFFATPDYFAQYGYPKQIEELKEHRCVVSRTVLRGETWVFQHEGKYVEIAVSPILQADNHHIIKDALLHHLGIACMPYFLVQNELISGQLVPIFVACQIPPIPIYAVFSQARKISSKIDVFLQYLVSIFDMGDVVRY